MYKAYCDGKLMYDPRSKDLALMNPILDLALNGAGSFSFTMPPAHPFYDAVKRVTSVVTVLRDGVEIFSGRVMEQSEDFFKQRTFYVEGELAYLNDTIQRPAAYEGTPEAFLKAIIGIHNGQVEEEKQFTVGRVTVTGSGVRYSNYENTWKTLKDALISQLGGYIFIRKENGVRYIDYLAELPNTSNQVIDFGLNLLDYSSNMDVTDIVTAVIPLGHQLESDDQNLTNRLTIASVNNGVDNIRSEAAIAEYGYICKVKIWDDVTMAQPLKEKGECWLRNTQWEKMRLDVTAVDLHDLNADADAIHLGDNVRVYSEPHGMDRYFPVSEMQIKLDSPADNIITMGIASDDLSDRMDNIETSISGVQQNVEKTVVRLEETEKGISSKVSKGELITEINQSAEAIELKGNRIIIESDNFTVSEDGTISARNGEFTGKITSTADDGIWQVIIDKGEVRTSFTTDPDVYTKIEPALFQQAIGAKYVNIIGGDVSASGNVAALGNLQGNVVIANSVTANAFSGFISSLGVVPTYQAGTYGAYIAVNGTAHAATTNYTETAAATIAGNLIASAMSDLRLKKDIASLDVLGTKEKWLEVLDEMKIKSFSYKPDTYELDDGKKHLGTVAQLLDNLLKKKGLEDYGLIRERDYPENSRIGEYTGGEKALGVDYVGLVPLLVLGYQELKKQIEELKKG